MEEEGKRETGKLLVANRRKEGRKRQKHNLHYRLNKTEAFQN